MDVFDAARRAAASLHAAAVQRGADPCRPNEIVKIAAEIRDVEISMVHAGSPMLSGALAFFDPNFRQICCSDESNGVDQALLIAHELGHVLLHAVASSRCDKADIDPGTSMETAPVGLERVTDYGARDRRELQANVFARELLLPIQLVKRLFVDESLRAVDIASKTGLAPRLVRQQILDATLLPAAEEQPTALRVEPPLDESQRVAAHHQGSAYNLQAGPGTGKTRTLVERVRWLIEQDVDPASILVLTFSNRAAGELSERFSAAMPEAAPRIWTGTFHAFGLDLIRRFHERLGRSADPRLFDRSDAIAALQEVLPTLPLLHYRELWNPAFPLRNIVFGISRAKDELVDPTRFRELAAAMLHDVRNDAKRVTSDAERKKADAELKKAEECLEAATVYEIYERTLAEHDAVDFGDLIMRPTLMLEGDEALRAQLNERHRYVLVDEFQDVNRASARLLMAICGDGKRLWVVGDARQSIYRFRGASPANVQRFGDDFGGEAGSLAVNYRSSEQIVGAFCHVARKMQASVGQLPLNLEAYHGVGPSAPTIVSFPDRDAELAGVVDAILSLQAEGVALRHQAVLCRSNAKLAAVAAALEARGVPALHLGSFFERDDVRDLLALLSLSVDRFGSGLVRVGGWARYDLSLQDVAHATQWLMKEERRPIEGIADCAREGSDLSADGAAGLALLAENLDGLSQSQPPWEFLCTYLLDRTDYVRDIARDGSIAGRMKAMAVWQFLNFVQAPTFGSGSPVRRVLDRVRELVLLAEERGLREVPNTAQNLDAVRLMTVHGSKGLEFEAVHLPGMTLQSFPVQWSGLQHPQPRGLVNRNDGRPVTDLLKEDQAAEEECLFFVALSRAKRHLRLYRSETSPSGRQVKPSPYLDYLREAGVRETSGPRDSAPTMPRRAVIVVRSVKSEPKTIEDLVQYERCPRRYFYTRILRLGNSRQQTAFSLTHASIHAYIGWLKDPKNLAAATPESIAEAFDNIWETVGPTEHAFASQYRALALSIVDALTGMVKDEEIDDAAAVELAFANGTVVVNFDLAGKRAGRRFVRRLNTGKERSYGLDRIDYSLYRLAADEIGADAEAVFLTSGVRKPITLKPKKSDSERQETDKMLEGMRRGDFHVEPDAMRCPVCPHFFICDAVPMGSLEID